MDLADVIETILNPCLALFSPGYDSQQARLMLLAIGLQESGFVTRQQDGGPAHGFWQFELVGTQGVLDSPATATLASQICAARGVAPYAAAVYARLLVDDVLACAFARLLLWTDPNPLPQPNDPNDGWQYYLRNWRPGAPGPSRWLNNWQQAETAVGAGGANFALSAGRESLSESPQPQQALSQEHSVTTDYQSLWLGKRGGTAHVKCIGVRGAADKGRGNLLGVYDDLFVLAIGDAITKWKGSTDPGQYFIAHPVNPRGCAQLKEGIWMFKAGILHGKWPCFVQAEAFSVNRLDHQGKISYVDYGEFGIDLHSGGPGISIDRFSAGCQIIWSPEGYFGKTWQDFFDPAVDAMRSASQSLLPYMLIDESSLE